MNLPVTLSYRPTLAEQLEAARAYQASTRKHRVYRVVSILAVLAAVWSLATAGFHPLVLVWFGLALFTWFDPLPLLMVWFSFRGQASAPPYQAIVEQPGITFDAGGQRVQRPWARYKQIIESPKTLILVYGNWAYSVIPRRAIGDAQTQQRFLAMVRGKIQKSDSQKS